jgi:hypothetical protein
MTQYELLDQLEAELREMLAFVRNQIATLPESTLRSRGGPEQWNILECFAHLNAYTDFYLSRIDLAIHKAKARKWVPAQNMNSGWIERRVIKKVDPARPFKRRKSPKKFNFMRQSLATEEVKRFIISSEKLLRCIQAAREIDLNRPKIQMAHTSAFKFRPGNLFQYLVLHAKRHLAQIEKLADPFNTKTT